MAARTNRAFIVCLILLLSPVVGLADNRMYHCELGVQAGAGYYVGELAQHVFQSTREVYGAQFRYKFDQRWALQTKLQCQNVLGHSLLGLDVAGEFNFFRFGSRGYDYRVKQITPFVLVGVGASWDLKERLGVYLPVGIGLKWKFADRWQLQAAWQHNVYLYNGDGLEGEADYNDTHGLNGSNIMNNDITSSITVGVVFEFGKGKKICAFCKEE